MRKGYRNSDEEFMIDSNAFQFNFDPSAGFLKVDFFKNNKEKLASIERVNFYLKDGRLIKNIFLFAGEYAYYFEKGKYTPVANPYDLVYASPDQNLLKHFNFDKEDVVLIRADNDPKPAKLGLKYWLTIEWLFLQKPNPLDTEESLDKNTLIEIDTWQKLPLPSDDDLYSNEGSRS